MDNNDGSDNGSMPEFGSLQERRAWKIKRNEEVLEKLMLKGSVPAKPKPARKKRKSIHEFNATTPTRKSSRISGLSTKTYFDKSAIEQENDEDNDEDYAEAYVETFSDEEEPAKEKRSRAYPPNETKNSADLVAQPPRDSSILPSHIVPEDVLMQPGGLYYTYAGNLALQDQISLFCDEYFCLSETEHNHQKKAPLQNKFISDKILPSVKGRMLTKRGNRWVKVPLKDQLLKIKQFFRDERKRRAKGKASGGMTIQKIVKLGLPAPKFKFKQESMPNPSSTPSSSTAEEKTESTTGSSLIKPLEEDVICGRGNTFYGQKGTRHFRETVRLLSKKYEASSAAERREIAKEVINSCNPGRFLRTDGSSGIWRELSVNDVFLKVEDAFKYLRRKKRESRR